VTGFYVDHDQLRDHANRIDQIGSSVKEASAAASSVNLDSGAFGVMCAFLPPILSSFTPTNASAIGSAASNLGSAAEAVRAMADDYRDSDQAAADVMNILGEQE
jgi:hypothetical protein